MVNGLKTLTFFARCFILDVWQDSSYVSENGFLGFELTLRVNVKVTDAQHWFHDGRRYAYNEISAKTLKLLNKGISKVSLNKNVRDLCSLTFLV